jgi:hypothetical protein
MGGLSMKIAMLVLGVLATQVAVALFIARWIRAGKGPRLVEAVRGFAEPPGTASGAGPTHAAIDNYDDLAALLIALDPHAEKAAAREDKEEGERASSSVTRPSNQLGPWPGARTR